MDWQERELLHWCDECKADYPARWWHRSKIWHHEGVTGWLCPKGHEWVTCDSGAHEWEQTDEFLQTCHRCWGTRFGIAKEPSAAGGAGDDR
jgi:hypothetical protein